MARVAEPRHAVSGLIVAAYHAGVQGPAFQTPAYPTDEHRALIKINDATGLLAEAEDAIKNNDQGRVTAAIQIYGERGYSVDPVFDLMLKYAVSEDGRLHAEKYYNTVREEYRTIRPAFRWRQVSWSFRSRRDSQRLRLQPRGQARIPRGRIRRRLQTVGRERVNRQPENR